MTQPPLPSVETFERAGLEAWPGIEVKWDGNWVRRAAGGYTKRANSVQCFDPNDDADVEDRIIGASSWLVVRGVKPVFRITPLSAPALNEALDDAGWDTIDHSYLYAMPIADHEPDSEAKLFSVLDPAFIAVQQKLQNYPEPVLAGMKALLGVMAVPATGIVVYRDGEPVASGLMAISNGIVITGNVVTDPTRRRQGLAAAMMQTGLNWAKSKGAKTAALNVQADNPGAQALYQKLGFTHQYDYTYRIPGAVK
ncbi:GNAT family N-acetyltransferase [Devosia sp. BK]|uniref:GNAT family N-acetyltransferase n=1 Tax=Devosia sp. BK TaxID=2871706 RepID=UPI00293A63B0|nr:GNAT family N-acetyltransferase [Devosia sp. BK]MDV3252090.1 GNAT family N-acetyltransferase [Devosia sp. BK]